MSIVKRTIVLLLLCLISDQAEAVNDAQSSKIVSFGVLENIAVQSSKIVSFAVLISLSPNQPNKIIFGANDNWPMQRVLGDRCEWAA